jgi:Cilia- and flagella-associated protein 91
LDENDENEVPEVVYVAGMIDSVTYPGLREVEIIERARKRRTWENALPPIKSPDEISQRAAAMEAFEWEEWIAREKEINECQQARLKIVADLISKREKKHLDDTNQKLESCKKRILEERKHQKDILM